MTLSAALEALLFVAERPLRATELAHVLEVSVDSVDARLAEWSDELESEGRGITLRRVADGWRLFTKPEMLPYLERFNSTDEPRRLSGAALEVLAVVAYKQPVTRSQIAEVRGVDSSSALRTLLRHGLVDEVGRLPTPGNPAMYATTGLLLEVLGINSLHDLPALVDHMPDLDTAETLDRPSG